MELRITRHRWSLALAVLALMWAGSDATSATPVENEIQELLAADGVAFDRFGISVALDGDTAIIGAHLDDDNGSQSGSAYVFTRSGGTWTQQQKLIAADGAPGDLFGSSVALDGDTAIIGAYGDVDNGTRSGSAYVFTRSGSTWTQQQKLIAADGAPNDLFSLSVALDGDTAIIGANQDDDNGGASGSAYVFTRSGSTWTEQQKLLAADGGAGDVFGFSVALDSDTAIIGAYRDGDSGGGSGSAYVFTHSGGTWTQQQKLLAADGASKDFFGFSVALDSDTAIIGAYGDSDDGSQSGSAYVFTRSAGNWTEQAKLTAADGASSDRFGWSVALDGDAAVVGAYWDDDNGSQSGSAYLFTRSGSTWLEQAKLLASDGANFDQLGSLLGVDVSGSLAIAGVPLHDHTSTDDGAAYIFAVTVDDEGPLTTNVLASPNPVPADTNLVMTANVDDTTTGGSTIASAGYTVNGGAASAMAASDGAFDEVSEDVTATIPGGLPVDVYEVCVSGTDSAGNTGNTACTLLAVYDPSAGFVSGGGWINSPADACYLTLECESVTGKANFGFVSKYKKGAQTPTGNTEFQFKAGDLNFHSTAYDWLVVAGHKAQYKGVGTINGMGNYGFILFAVDAELTPSTDVDLFRIKIWDKDDGDRLVYDNEVGANDDAEASTAIGGGSIVIHKKN